MMTSTLPDSQDSSASQTGRQLLDSLHSAEAGPSDTAGEVLGVQSKHRHRLSSSADQVREFWLALFVTEASAGTLSSTITLMIPLVSTRTQ